MCFTVCLMKTNMSLPNLNTHSRLYMLPNIKTQCPYKSLVITPHCSIKNNPARVLHVSYKNKLGQVAYGSMVIKARQ